MSVIKLLIMNSTHNVLVTVHVYDLFLQLGFLLENSVLAITKSSSFAFVRSILLKFCLGFFVIKDK